MVINRRRVNWSKRAALTSLLLCVFLVLSLVAWSAISTPRLETTRRVAPVDYSALFDTNSPRYNLEVEKNAAVQPETADGVQNLLPPGQNSNSNAVYNPPITQAKSRPTDIPTARPTALPKTTPGVTVVPSNGDVAGLGNRGQSLLPNVGNGQPNVPAVAQNKDKLTYLAAGNSAPVGKITARGAEFIDETGTRYFAAGVNYEGHTDRAWSMWNNDRWDANLVDQNMKMAADGGYNTIRIFVQTALRDDILRGDWTKFDKMVEIARKHNLRLLITFGDYFETDVSRLMQIDGLVAQHFSGNPTIFGYDLRNEPQFSELIGLVYPNGRRPVLQTDAMIKQYGEKLTQGAVDEWRRGEGSKYVPGYLDSYQGYIYANMIRWHEAMVEDSGNWMVRNGLYTVMDFYDSPDGQKWRPFFEAMNQTLQNYIDLRQGTLHGADPGRLVTIGWNRADLAKLPANRSLGFVSFHRFAGSVAGGLAETLGILDHMKHYFSNKPVVMEEFGYSNWDQWSKQEVPLTKSAAYETSIWLFLYGRGYAGGFKWMLNNFTLGANPYENNFGLLDNNTQPKPAYYAARSVLQLVNANRAPTGDFGRLESFDGVTIHYVWGSSNALFGNNKEFKDSRVQISQMENAPWAIWWPNAGQGEVYLNTTVAAQIRLDLRAIFPNWTPDMQTSLTSDKSGNVRYERPADSTLFFTAVPGQLYTVKLPLRPAAFMRAQPLNINNNIYFKETGHNLSNSFKKYWERNGGLNLFGFPISEEFIEGGFTVQYFERAKFEYHPEFSGSANEVMLGLLGRWVTAGRREKGETPFQSVAPFNNTATEQYFGETGHSLRGGFKLYWERNGGLAMFGFPISEEFAEVNPADGKTYTVQYFERNRFEWHPEKSGTSEEFQLGLLGLQIVRDRGWLS
jgi:hypothetical protein